uniref:Ubiquitin-like protease family profile domain-containing protein n=1 Tax=Globisporangium ultimum (strain ATCC 200006 / CBS 805.95 / DAOM BR144) TaxID=431595 RepID=K3XCM4_GLOUD
MNHFYEVKARCDLWVAEMRWLCGDWSKMNLLCYPALFYNEIEAHFSYLGESRKNEAQKLHHMLSEAISRYEWFAMRTRFTLTSRIFGVNFEEVIGYLARDSILNDSVVHFACQAICDWTEDCVFVNSLVFSVGGTPKVPTRKISTTEYVVLPVHLSDIHWGVLICNITSHFAGQVTELYYKTNGINISSRS